MTSTVPQLSEAPARARRSGTELVAARQEAAEARRKARVGRKLERRWARVSAGIEVAMWEADLSYSAATRVAEAMDRLYYPEAWK